MSPKGSSLRPGRGQHSVFQKALMHWHQHLGGSGSIGSLSLMSSTGGEAGTGLPKLHIRGCPAMNLQGDR